MWRNLMSQAIYQITVLLILQFGGESFNVTMEVNNRMIFNTFVQCQVFNEFNSMKPEKRNVFEGLHRNRLFVGIIFVTIVLQVLMVGFLKKFADTERFDVWKWLVCIAIAAPTWPIGCFVKLVPVPETSFLTYIGRSKLIFQRLLNSSAW